MQSCEERGKVGAALGHGDDLAVEDESLRGNGGQRLDQLREVARERLLIATAEVDLLRGAEGEAAEPIPLRLVEVVTYEGFAAAWPSREGEFADKFNTMPTYVVSSEHDLVDELRLMVFPVVLGSGKRLFDRTSDKKPFRLVDSKTVGDGVAILVYAPTGGR